MGERSMARGFTLIEMMLSMSFIGMLLIAIAATSMQVMSVYTKGMTIREVNQAGRLISEDMERMIATVPPFKVIPAKTGDASDPPEAADSKYVTRDGGGRLCTGNYTYAWNYGKTKELSGDGSLPNAYNKYTDSTDVVRFVKVRDSGATLCADTNKQIAHAAATELLISSSVADPSKVGDRNLVIQQLIIGEGSRHSVSGQALYSISLILGTNDQTQLNATATNCLPPSQGSGNENFCAINQFEIVARAGNRAGSLR